MYLQNIIKQAAGMGPIPDSWKDTKDSEGLIQRAGKFVDGITGLAEDAWDNKLPAAAGAGAGLWAITDGRDRLSQFVNSSTRSPRRGAKNALKTLINTTKTTKNPFEALSKIRAQNAGFKSMSEVPVGALRNGLKSFMSKGFGNMLLHNPLTNIEVLKAGGKTGGGKAKAIFAILGALAAAGTAAKLKD